VAPTLSYDIKIWLVPWIKLIKATKIFVTCTFEFIVVF